MEGEQSGVFPSKVEGSQPSVIISAVATALAFPHHLVLGQRSIPDVCTVAKGCAGLSPLIPSCEAFCISLSSETLATHLAFSEHPPVTHRETSSFWCQSSPNFPVPFFALAVFLKKRRIKMHPRGFTQDNRKWPEVVPGKIYGGY